MTRSLVRNDRKEGRAIRDPITIEGVVTVDRHALVGVVRQEGRVLIFLRGCRPINIPDTLSREEFEELTKRIE